MNAPDPYPPLVPDHPVVRDGTVCPYCEQPFVGGAVTCLLPVGEPDADNVYEARLLHHDCAERLATDATVRGAVREVKRGFERAVGFPAGVPSDDDFTPSLSLGYLPLAADHPAVTSGEKCLFCDLAFAAGDATNYAPLISAETGNWVARRVHHACAERVRRERLRSATAQDPRFAFLDSDEQDAPERELAQLREALAVYQSDSRHWREYALTLERTQPDDSRRLAWIEARLREHGPDLGYLLGLPQGWTNLRAAIDQAQASGR